MKENQENFLKGSSITMTQKLWHAMQAIWYADGLAYTLNSLQVNSLPEISGNWITTLEERVAMLNQAGGKWHGVREKITSPLLSPVISYSNRFSVLNEHLTVSKDMDSEEIILYIQNLYEEARENAKTVRQAKQEFADWDSSIDNIFSLLKESLEEGWKALDVEEVSVNELTAEMAVMQSILTEVQNGIMPETLSKEGSFAKSFGKILYTALIAGEPVTFFSVGSLFFSVGSTFYEIFSSHKKVKVTVEKIRTCKKELNQRQQALAQTKILIRFLYELQLKVALLNNEMDEVIDVWQDEISFLQGKLSSFRAGADPKRTNIVTETAAWETLLEYAKKFLDNDFRSDTFNLEV